MEAWSAVRGWPLEPAVLSRLETLMGLWIAYARAMNLTGARGEEELTRHVLDGLDCVVCAEACGAVQGRWVDVGSGGGFPGLVVAATGRFEVTLIEPRKKRAAFLDLAVGMSDLWKTRVIRDRIDDSTWNQKCLSGMLEAEMDRYDVASARAVFEPARWLELGKNVVRNGGLVIVHCAHGAPSAGSQAPSAAISGECGVVEGHRWVEGGGGSEFV
jgi:16S rRNA (guanine527-N7)-methyltransferase